MTELEMEIKRIFERNRFFLLSPQKAGLMQLINPCGSNYGSPYAMALIRPPSSKDKCPYY